MCKSMRNSPRWDVDVERDSETEKETERDKERRGKCIMSRRSHSWNRK